MKAILLVSSCFVALAAAAPALAQAVEQSPTAGPTPPKTPQTQDQAVASGASTDKSTMLGEVVVTAQRREERLQKAPVTITAVGADTLAKNNVTDFQQLSAVLPNTEVTVTGGARVQIATRGIRNNDFSPGAESPVAVSVDGAYVPRQTGLSGQFYDISRVESLPGPQGTLYGRNAAAGAINIITNHPKQANEASAEVEYGNYNAFRGFGMVNIPITDEVAVRAAFQRFEHDGYNKTGGDDADQTSGRVQLQWNRGPSRLFLSADYSKIGGHGTIDNDLNNPPRDSRAIYGPNAQDLSGIDVTQDSFIGQWDYDLKFATFTVEGAHRQSVENSRTLGNDELSRFSFKSVSDTLEARLASNDTKPFSWVVGAFGFNERQPSYGIVSANPFNPYGAGNTCGLGVGQVTCGNYLPQLGLATMSYAIFGQTTWTPIDPLHITLGLRYSHDRKAYAGSYLCQIGGNADHTDFALGVCKNAPVPLDAGNPSHFQSTDYKAGISYDLSPTSLVYFNTSTGYRAGGSFISPFFPTYGPEHIKNYEGGWKNQLFDRRLIVNVDGYYQTYSDFIYTYGVIGDLLPNIPGVFIPFSGTQADNIASVDIYGADLTAAFLLTPDDLLNGGVEYLHTEIGNATLRCTATVPTDNGPCAPTAGFINPTGKPLPNTPEWRLTGSYEHTFRLKSGATIVPRVQVHFESGRPMNLSNFPGTYQDDFTQTDAQIVYTSPEKNWTVTAYVQNLEDNDVFLSADAANGAHPLQFPSGGTAVYRAPRTFGAKVGVHF